MLKLYVIITIIAKKNERRHIVIDEMKGYYCLIIGYKQECNQSKNNIFFFGSSDLNNEKCVSLGFVVVAFSCVDKKRNMI